MTFRTSILWSLKNLRRNLSRSILTMIGIIIGIAAVITIVAIGEAYKSKTIEEITGDNEGNIILNTIFMPNDDYSNFEDMNQTHFTEKDGELLRYKDYIESLEFMDDDQALGVPIDINIRHTNIQAMMDGFEETNHEDIIGRNLMKVDNDRMKNVAVVDGSIFSDNVDDNDFEKYLGSILTMNTINYEIIGIIPSLEEEEEELFFGFEPDIKIPKSTYENFKNSNNNIYGIEIVLKENVDVKESIKDVEKTLNESGSDKDKGKYEVFDSSGIVNMLGGVLNTITTFIAIVAGISLFIAGIGVMNMVYTSVSERTLEIGIKRALGARKKDIKREFLLEGIMITFSGGFIGYILGMVIAFIASFFLELTVRPSPTTAIIAVSISIVIGITSSIFPAQKAANKNTIDILR